MNKYKLLITCLVLFNFTSVCVAEVKNSSVERKVFPHKMPTERPNFPLSAAMTRMFDYPTPRVQDNPLFSQFKYTRLKGFDYNGGDGTISRRDPSRPILVDGTYYIWYTKRDTIVPPIGAKNAAQATDTIPSTDWDLAEIWYATSKDGFTWEEQGVAVKRPSKPYPGHRSVATPDILVWEGKYYLYYQGFVEPSGLKGDFCPVTVSVASSPMGPWEPTNRVIIHSGKKGDWDQDQTHDPMPIVYNGKIHVYYKATYNKWPHLRTEYAVGNGVAIAEHPLGPFKKHPLNPLTNSGHEASYFRFKEGVASFVGKDGNERHTMQYAEDGINFKIASIVDLAPRAPAAFSKDAFTDNKYATGVTWGMSHFVGVGEGKKKHSMLARFDCDLSTTVKDKSFKMSGAGLKPDVYFNQKLSPAQLQRIAAENKALTSK